MDISELFPLRVTTNSTGATTNWYAYPRATPSHGPPRRVPTNSLISRPDSGSVPVADRSPLPISQPTPYNGATCWPDPRKMSRSDPPREMNSRISDSDVWGLNPQRGLWYLLSNQKALLKFPILPAREFQVWKEAVYA